MNSYPSKSNLNLKSEWADAKHHSEPKVSVIVDPKTAMAEKYWAQSSVNTVAF